MFQERLPLAVRVTEVGSTLTCSTFWMVADRVQVLSTRTWSYTGRAIFVLWMLGEHRLPSDTFLSANSLSSVMPSHIAAHIQATVYAIAEKVSLRANGVSKI